MARSPRPSPITFRSKISPEKDNPKIINMWLCQVCIISICAIALALLGITYYVVSLNYAQYSYIVAIEARQGGTEAILYRWPPGKRNGTADLAMVASCDMVNALTSYDDEKKAADDLLKGIQDDLFLELEKVIKPSTVPIIIAGSSGLHVVNLTHPEVILKLFNAIKSTFTELNLHKLSIVNQSETALYPWISVNFAKGTLYNEADDDVENPTAGVVTMGQASLGFAQDVTKLGIVEPTADLKSLNLFGRHYTVEAYSYLCYGIEEAYQRMLKLCLDRWMKNPTVDDLDKRIPVPCLTSDYTESTLNYKVNYCNQGKVPVPSEVLELYGTGNYDACQQLISDLLDQSTCASIDGFKTCLVEHLDVKKGVKLFYVLGVYYQVFKALKQIDNAGRVNGDAVLKAAMQACTQDGDWFERQYSIPPQYSKTYCFKILYLHATLTKVLRFENWSEQLLFVDEILDTNLSTTLGLALTETASIPAEESLPPILFDVRWYILSSIVLLCIMGATSVILAQSGKVVKVETINEKRRVKMPSLMQLTKSNVKLGCYSKNQSKPITVKSSTLDPRKTTNHKSIKSSKSQTEGSQPASGGTQSGDTV